MWQAQMFWWPISNIGLGKCNLKSWAENTPKWNGSNLSGIFVVFHRIWGLFIKKSDIHTRVISVQLLGFPPQQEEQQSTTAGAGGSSHGSQVCLFLSLPLSLSARLVEIWCWNGFIIVLIFPIKNPLCWWCSIVGAIVFLFLFLIYKFGFCFLICHFSVLGR